METSMTQIFPPLVPPGMSTLEAMSRGLLPANVLVTGTGTTGTASVMSLLATDVLSGNGAGNAITFSSPAGYAGN
jgi:hypothetical protein